MSSKEEGSRQLVNTGSGEGIDLGMSARSHLQEGMSAKPEGKAMTARASVRPTAPPTKPADGGTSAKPPKS